MGKSTRQRLLELMVVRVGRSELAKQLQVPCAILRDWVDGNAPMPDFKLIALIDLIDQAEG